MADQSGMKVGVKASEGGRFEVIEQWVDDRGFVHSDHTVLATGMTYPSAHAYAARLTNSGIGRRRGARDTPVMWRNAVMASRNDGVGSCRPLEYIRIGRPGEDG